MKHLLILLLLLCSLHSFAQNRTLGVLKNDSASFNGYTLFAPIAATTTYLIDNCGQIVNTWESNFNPGVSAYLLEDGSLLRTARTNSSFNSGGAGGRIEQYSWEGDLIWGYTYSSSTYHQHHDIELMPNGNILLIAWEVHDIDETIATGRSLEDISDEGIWVERIVELKPWGTNQAQVVWTWSAWDHLIQEVDSTKANYGVVAEHPELLNINFEIGPPNRPSADWLHVNSIDYHPELDQIIINSRTFGECWIIDHSTTTAEAAGHTGGKYGKGGDILYRWGNPRAYNRGKITDQKLFGQHDAQWIEKGLVDEGKILFFNNGDLRLDGIYSSVDIIELPIDEFGHYTPLSESSAFGPTELTWTYTADIPTQFFSPRLSGAQRLPNGNTLICEGTKGHFFEVDSTGTVVWDYFNPIARNTPLDQGSIPVQNSVFRAYRYGADYEAFKDRDMTPGLPIEQNPFPLPCSIVEEAPFIYPGVEIITAQELGLRLYPNPIEDQLFIENTQNRDLQVQVIDATGRLLYEIPNSSSSLMIPTEQWQEGLYIIQIYDLKKQVIYREKIVK